MTDPATIDRIIAVLSPYVTPARLERLERALSNRTRDVVLVLEDIANAHNAAAVLRTAEAFGFFEVHVIEPESGRFKLSRNVASGSHKWLDIRWHKTAAETCRELKERGFRVYASDLQGEAIDVSAIDVKRPVALLFGNELMGLSEEAKALADGRFRVPMYGLVESLNISVAAAVSAYDLLSRRRAEEVAPGLTSADRRAVLAAWLVLSVGASRQILAREGLPVPEVGGENVVLVEGTGKA